MKFIKAASFIVIYLLFSRAVMADEMSDFAEKISRDYIAGEKQILFRKGLAIANFENTSELLKKYDVGATLSAMLSEKMSESTVFRLVERKNIDEIIREAELGQSGLIDAKTAVQAGELTGAELLIFGIVSEVGDEIVLNVKMVNTETGEVRISAKASFPRDELLRESRDMYMSSFQSKYGISVSINGGMIYNPDYVHSFNLTSVDFSYRAWKNVKIGIGYFNAGGNEIRRENETVNVSAGTTEVWRNYNVSIQGPKFSTEFIFPLFRWLNLSAGLDYMPGFINEMTQDISDFPMYAVDQSAPNTTYLTHRRILVTSFANEKNIPHLLALQLHSEFLISKRVSLRINAGYVFSTDYTPEVYDVGGHRQWFESIDENGTFEEYGNFNFARDKDGNRVKINFSGYTATAGIAMHF